MTVKLYENKLLPISSCAKEFPSTALTNMSGSSPRHLSGGSTRVSKKKIVVNHLQVTFLIWTFH
jgi:hypothetical protein